VRRRPLPPLSYVTIEYPFSMRVTDIELTLIDAVVVPFDLFQVTGDVRNKCWMSQDRHKPVVLRADIDGRGKRSLQHDTPDTVVKPRRVR
jgi:hypothetical protein